MANTLPRADLIEVFLKQASLEEIEDAISTWNDTLRAWKGPGEGRKKARAECAAVVNALVDARDSKRGGTTST